MWNVEGGHCGSIPRVYIVSTSPDPQPELSHTRLSYLKTYTLLFYQDLAPYLLLFQEMASSE